MKLFLRAIVAASMVAAPSAVLAESLQLQVPTTSNFTTNTDTSSTQPSTIQYNASMGQSNNFAVGTNTNFGVQSSASSTPDYSVSTSAILGSGAESILRNQIGSSGAASAADSFSTAATASANSAMSARIDAKYEAAVAAGYGSVSGETRDGWEAEYKASAEYSVDYNQAFSNAYSAISGSSSASNTAGGTISGDFVSVTTGSAGSQTSSAGSQVYVREDAGSGQFNYRVAGVNDFARDNVNFYSADGEGAGSYSAATTSEIAKAATSASGASNVTTNSVTVKGIGSDASFNTSANTKFEVGIDSNLGKVDATTGTSGPSLILSGGTDNKVSSSATANGSSTGNFGTNSTAASNSSTYTSVFYQAF